MPVNTGYTEEPYVCFSPEGLGHLVFPNLDSENTWIRIQTGCISVLGSFPREKKNQDIVLLMFSNSVMSDFCDPMNRSTPGFPVLHNLPEFAQTNAHWVSDAIQPLMLCRPLLSCPQSFQHQSLFQWAVVSAECVSTWEETAKGGEGEMTGKRKGMEASTDLIQLKLQVCKEGVCVGWRWWERADISGILVPERKANTGCSSSGRGEWTNCSLGRCALISEAHRGPFSGWPHPGC